MVQLSDQPLCCSETSQGEYLAGQYDMSYNTRTHEMSHEDQRLMSHLDIGVITLFIWDVSVAMDILQHSRFKFLGQCPIHFLLLSSKCLSLLQPTHGLSLGLVHDTTPYLSIHTEL